MLWTTHGLASTWQKVSQKSYPDRCEGNILTYSKETTVTTRNAAVFTFFLSNELPPSARNGLKRVKRVLLILQPLAGLQPPRRHGVSVLPSPGCFTSPRLRADDHGISELEGTHKDRHRLQPAGCGAGAVPVLRGALRGCGWVKAQLLVMY